MRHLLLLPGLLLPACYIQNRDLEHRIGRGCRTEQECVDLLAEVKAAGCGVGKQQCETQRDQLSAVEAALHARQAAAREAAAEQAHADRIRRAEEERIRANTERTRQETAAKAQDRLQARARSMAEWQERVARNCATGREDTCRQAPFMDPNEDEKNVCRTTCRASLIEHADATAARALGECLRAGANACEFPASVREELASKVTECGAACVQLQKEARGFPDRIHQYERCMLAADRSPEARKLEPYSDAMYNRFLRDAETRCRKAADCDRVERHPDFHCTWER